MMNSELITAAEAATLKGVSRTAIYKAIQQGRLNSLRLLGRIALSRDEVVRWQPSSNLGWPKGRPVSEEVKAKISQSQKQRWAKGRENQES